MKSARRWCSNLMLISLLLGSLNSIADVSYPANPSVDDSAIYLSDMGISKINKETLETEWRVLPNKQTFEPVVTKNYILVGSSTGLYVIDKITGSIIRNVQTNNTLFSPVVENNIAYVGSKAELFQAIDLQTGEILWSRKFEGWVYPPALFGEIIVVGGNRPYLSGLDKNTGMTIWKKWISQELVYSPVTIDEQQVVISTFGNETQLISSEDGTVTWILKNDVPNFSPIVINNKIIFGTLDGRLQSVDIDNGKLLWEHKIGGYLSVQAYPKKGLVMISNNQGDLILVNAGDGHIKWQKHISDDVVGVPVLLNDDVVVFISKKFSSSVSMIVFNSLKPMWRLL